MKGSKKALLVHSFQTRGRDTLRMAMSLAKKFPIQMTRGQARCFEPGFSGGFPDFITLVVVAVWN